MNLETFAGLHLPKNPIRASRRGLLLLAGASLAGAALATLPGCRRGMRGAGSVYRMNSRSARNRAVYTVAAMPESFFKEMDKHWADWLKHTKRLKLDNDTTKNPAAVDAFLKAAKTDNDIMAKPQPDVVIDAAGTAMGAGLIHRTGMKWGVLTSNYDPEEYYVLTDKGQRLFVSPWALTGALFNGESTESIADTTKKIENAIGTRDYTFFPGEG